MPSERKPSNLESNALDVASAHQRSAEIAQLRELAAKYPEEIRSLLAPPTIHFDEAEAASRHGK